MLEQLLANVEIFPLMGVPLNEKNTMKMDFSPSNHKLIEIDLSSTALFDRYVFGLLNSSRKQYGIGGYFEHRAIYQRSKVFATAVEDFRDIHLGVDIWTKAGHPVYTPIDGAIHSFQDNVGFGNYGPTIIMEHKLGNKLLYSLYGHLQRVDLANLTVGKKFKKGDLLCHVGEFPENGDWPAHLHFQLMWDMMGNVGDFPGVCSHREQEKYRLICPNPHFIIGY
ncbi:peptidoglycan DD-metalloendopeptidase family protein [Belliella sp. DSM 111904]|uniref:Peptidoglycan DD-metalloendopeptidase family protein n=1 Tax=Belliella filtrata TaxID=2923435 RepID=A0ABS9V2U6_9BACT|nr:peptidoglycan DD-metalloendopeptidase family protein [Belliella filtrata]MCH7410731.1 peptidoglycan DD-metalloendopeptidase family protein [Belliella filtrata]